MNNPNEIIVGRTAMLTDFDHNEYRRNCPKEAWMENIPDPKLVDEVLRMYLDNSGVSSYDSQGTRKNPLSGRQKQPRVETNAKERSSLRKIGTARLAIQKLVDPKIERNFQNWLHELSPDRPISHINGHRKTDNYSDTQSQNVRLRHNPVNLIGSLRRLFRYWEVGDRFPLAATITQPDTSSHARLSHLIRPTDHRKPLFSETIRNHNGSLIFSKGPLGRVLRKTIQQASCYHQSGLPAYNRKIFASIWEEETVPDKYGEPIIAPILKKGTRNECSNHRGGSLTPVVTRLLVPLILRSLTAHADANYCGSRLQILLNRRGSSITSDSDGACEASLAGTRHLTYVEYSLLFTSDDKERVALLRYTLVRSHTRRPPIARVLRPSPVVLSVAFNSGNQ
ncbi:hypothetical protein CLF_107439 [Clonorchis sinensis]|uniref:Uncharacterized protein n=1 Tax=Clonorchis sinensis TaxID=79923 RepID=G7YQK9_CLOSI|nr:hypothetical protein CLF_107439 [Clonorchis sinensis]